MTVYALHAIIVLFSLLAGVFWMASAAGVTITGRGWLKPERVLLDDLAAHHAKWNTRAALCASIAAVAQALLFLHNYPL